MPKPFDPYHRWLGIRPEDQPANHYRLLGLTPFEDDSEAISDAAQRQMAHVRTYQLGPNSAVSQTILNELAAAKACLLNPQNKADYDTRLREEQAAKAAPTDVPPARRSWWLVSAAGTAAVLLCLLLGILFVGGRESAPPQVAQAEPASKADPQPSVQQPQPESPPQGPPASTPAHPQANAKPAVIQPTAGPSSPALSPEKSTPPPKHVQPAPTPVSDPPAPSQPVTVPSVPGSNQRGPTTAASERAPASQPSATPPQAIVHTIVHTIVPSPPSNRSGVIPPHAQPEPVEKPSLESKSSKAGFVPLFNGRNLDGWHLRDPNGPHCWSVNRRELIGSSWKKGQDLITDRVFQDFELHLEFMLTPQSNTGVFLRGLHEIQLIDSNSASLRSNQSCGAIQGSIPPSENAYLGPGRWHPLDVKMVGQRVTVTMNGKCVIRDAFVSESTAPEFTLPIKPGEPGPIVLQSWERESRFRNIRIRSLSTGGRTKD